MPHSQLKNIRIILVEPAGALNVGSVARAMKNMGLERLILVNPRCDPAGEEARRMAVHGGDVLEKAQWVGSLPEGLQGCHRAIATTARTRKLPVPLEPPKTVLPWFFEEESLECALIFGPEDRGLNNEELNYAQRFLGIPANPEYSSLNLAQAVVVCTYELYQIATERAENEAIASDFPIELASLDNLEGYYQHLERVLLEIGYLYPHTATARMEKFRRIFNRIELTQEEVAMLRGILRQTEWAMNSKVPTQNVSIQPSAISRQLKTNLEREN
ncbi:MAG: RNA methyltransferase [Cyanobacteriota bacterium]|nr:RNA methyltransferase [Cyanobacteriota bacterium]